MSLRLEQILSFNYFSVINEERSDLKSSREDEIPDDHLGWLHLFIFPYFRICELNLVNNTICYKGADIEAYTNENSSMSTL